MQINRIARRMVPRFVKNAFKFLRKTYKAYDGYILRSKQGKRKNRKRIAFIVYYPQSWRQLQPIYEAAMSRPDVKAFLVVVQRQIELSDGQYVSNVTLFRNLGLSVIDAGSDGKKFDLSVVRPDITFLQTPYNEAYPSVYSSRNISKYSKLCYVPYGFEMSPNKHLDIEYNEDFFSYVYAIFACSSISYKYCCCKRKTNRWYSNIILYNKGYPRFDFEKEVAEKCCAKSYLWIPRWATDAASNDRTSFFDYNEKLIAFFSEHTDLELIIRPHPSMFDYFIRIGLMSLEDVKEYRLRIENTKNMKLDDEMDYLNSFSKSDVLIADFSSIDIEYYLTGKPILYCGDVNALSGLPNRLIDSLYLVDNWNELESNILNTSRGEDESYNERIDVIQSLNFGDIGNIGRNILETALKI